MIITGWFLSAFLLISRAWSMAMVIQPRGEECLLFLPDKADSIEGSFLVSDNNAVDFVVRTVADGWSDSGKEVLRRNAHTHYIFDVKAPKDTPHGYLFSACWSNQNSKKVTVFFTHSVHLVE